MRLHLLLTLGILCSVMQSMAQTGCTTSSKLVLSSAMMTAENGGNANSLVDEQAAAGDPAQGSGGAPTTVWAPSSNPGSAYMDLGVVTNLTAIYLRDVNNVGDFTVSYGTPGNWTILFTDDCGTYLNWKQHIVNVSTRYLRFTRDGGANVSEVVLYGCSGTTPPTTDGVITYQKWNNIQGNAVSALTGNSAFPASPSSTSDLTLFEAPANVGDNYGARIIGYVTAPQTGVYYFWIAADDNTELWLSTDASAANKQKIASHTVWTNSREWNKYPSQKSAAVTLTAGVKYYVEALMKEGGGGDNLAVGWRKPSDGAGTIPTEVIPGSALSRYATTPGDTQAPTVPTGLAASAIATTSATLSWTASTDNVAVTGYEVYKNGALLTTVTGTTTNVTGLTASTSYTFKVRAKDAANNYSAYTSDLNVTTTSGSTTAEGFITYQRWNGITGTAVSDLTTNANFPATPSITTDLSYFEALTDIGNNYGVRIAGYIIAPQSGAYSFWIAGDDNVELWLSTNSSAASKVKIAYHTSWTNSRDWNKFPTQKSVSITLSAGVKYYVEALLKEDVGGDNLAVGWRKPSDGAGTVPTEVIPGTVLSRLIPADTQAPTAPTSLISTSTSAGSVSLSWTASTDAYGVVGYDVYRSATKVNNMIVTGTTYTATGLASSTAYTFTVKARDAAGNVSSSSNAVRATTNAATILSDPRVVITESMITNETGLRDDRGSFLNLFDEQSAITNNAPAGPALTHWRVGGDASDYPANLIVDLGQEYDISNVYWFDMHPMIFNGVDIEVKGGRFELETGTPFNWTLKYGQVLANDSAWHNNATTFRTRYLHIKKYSTASYMWQTYGPFAADAPLMEMIIYGKPAGTGQPPQPPTNQHTPLNIPMNTLIGGNSWWYGDTTTFQPLGMVRAYHDLKRSGSVNLTDPLDMEGYDAFYGRNLTASYEIYPCLQGNADGTDNKPTFGGDPLLPESYRIHADNMWQWAARYGRNTSIPLSSVRVLSYQTKKVGLGYLNFLENWNEEDKWWAGAGPHFTPFQFAAMSSADYDGHLGTMGATVGIKNADPTMKMVMGGLASTSPDFIKGMKLWADANRGGSFPADVLNFHYYARINDEGVSPEADHFLDRMQNLVRYRNYNLPDKEIWLSEFGWDVEGGSLQQAKGHTQWPNNGFDSEQLQGIWLVRSYLFLAKAGIDRAQMYTIGDAGGGWGTYATSGLVTYDGVKRKSWYYLSTLKNRLTDMVYVGEVESGNPNVLIYKFKSLTGSNGVYAIWSPTSNGTTVPNYALIMGGTPSVANSVALTGGNPNGTQTALTISGNVVHVNVSESPVFVTVNIMDGTIPNSPSARVSQAEVVTAVAPETEARVIVYPNPGHDFINVSFKGIQGGTLHLFDLAGREQRQQVIHGDDTQLDVRDLKKGMYLLKLNSGGQYTYHKIIIE